MNERPMESGRKILAGLLAGALTLTMIPCASAQTAGATPTAKSDKQPDLNAAKRHYGDGDKKYKAGDYAGALPDFEAANEIKSTPQAERYIGLCHDQLGHLQEASRWYDKFLAHVPEKLASQGDEIRKRNAEIKALPGKVHVASNPPGATVTVDGQAQATPTPIDVVLPPGGHTIHLTAPGRLPADRQIDVAFASSQSETVELEAEPPPPPPPPVAVAEPPALPPAAPPPPERRSMVPAYVTGALAVAAAGVGTVFGILALNDKSDYDKNPTAATANSGDTHALIADMSFGVALTFGVTSAVLFLTRDEPAASAAVARARGPARDATKALTVTPAPWVGARSGGAGVVVRF